MRFEALAAAEGFALTEQQLEQFDQYAEFLVEYNEKVNLTAITDPEGIEIKHFLDSLLLLKAVKLGEGASVIDVGTGAGFPSVPAKIVREDLQLTLLDGLNKRIVFLEELSRRLGQQNTALHGRAEEAARRTLPCMDGQRKQPGASCGNSLILPLPVRWQIFGCWQNTACPLSR